MAPSKRFLPVPRDAALFGQVHERIFQIHRQLRIAHDLHAVADQHFCSARRHLLNVGFNFITDDCFTTEVDVDFIARQRKLPRARGL